MSWALGWCLCGAAAACGSDDGGANAGKDQADGGGAAEAGGRPGAGGARPTGGGPAAGGAPAIDDAGPDAPGGGSLFVRSGLPRVPATAVNEGMLAAVVRGNEEFAFALYSRLRTKPGNVFFSPFSLGSAMAMAWAGARGTTASEITRTFHFGPPPETHAGWNALEQAVTTTATDLEVHVANALWLAPRLRPLPQYLDLLAANYGAGVGVVDFSDPAGAADLIDGWVSDETAGAIPRLLEARDLSGTTTAVLTNAIRFEAAFVTPFEETSTADDTFHGAAGDRDVPMMHGLALVRYAESPAVQAAALPFRSDGSHAFELVVILPKEDLAVWEASLTPGSFDAVVESLAATAVDLTLPRYTLRTDAHLKPELVTLGMPTPFDAAADFTGMSAPDPRQISDVIHQAFVDVNEKGVTAAGATAIVFGDGGAIFDAAPPPVLVLDRPFFVAIRHVGTGALLFMGRTSVL